MLHTNKYKTVWRKWSGVACLGGLALAALWRLAAAPRVAPDTTSAESNANPFGAVRADSAVLLVQVRRDATRLRALLASLSQVRAIGGALLVVSHGCYDRDIDTLVKSINFCRVTQIYFPHSRQLRPLAEKKQHWWWKANFVLDRMDHEGVVIFLEEDNLVAPDLLHVSRFLQRCQSRFPDVDVASYGKPYAKGSRNDLLLLEPWTPPFHVGLAFNVTAWKKIKAHSEEYCMYDDYNWNYSLLNLFKSFAAGHAGMVACSMPRVISTRELNEEDLLKTMNEFLYGVEWFPEKVQAVYVFGPEGRLEATPKTPPRGVGGWSDLRDQLLCLDVLSSATERERRYYDNTYGSVSFEKDTSK